MQKAREYKAKGSILFDYAHLKNNYIDALKTRIFNSNYDDRNYNIKMNSKYQENKNPNLKVKLNKKEKKKRWRKNRN